MHMRLPSLIVALAFLVPGMAYADTISTFNITGSSLFYGMGGDRNTVTGTTTIDVTTGLVQDISFTAGGVYESGVDAQYGADVYVGAQDVHFTFSGASLINFRGENFNLNGPNDLYVGQVTYAGSPSPISITPEPASMLLLSTGLLGILCTVRRRVDLITE